MDKRLITLALTVLFAGFGIVDLADAGKNQLHASGQKHTIKKKLGAGFGPSKQIPSKKLAPKKVELKKFEPRKVELKKFEPKKVELKKFEPKKVELKKFEPKKIELKKFEPKKVELKKFEPKKIELKKFGPKKVVTKKLVKKSVFAKKVFKNKAAYPKYSPYCSPYSPCYGPYGPYGPYNPYGPYGPYSPYDPYGPYSPLLGIGAHGWFGGLMLGLSFHLPLYGYGPYGMPVLHYDYEQTWIEPVYEDVLIGYTLDGEPITEPQLVSDGYWATARYAVYLDGTREFICFV